MCKAQSTSQIESDLTRQTPFALAAGLNLLLAWILWQAFLALTWLFSAIMAVRIVAIIVPCAGYVTDDHMQLIAWTAICVIRFLIMLAARLWDSAMVLWYFVRRAIRLRLDEYHTLSRMSRRGIRLRLRM